MVKPSKKNYPQSKACEALELTRYLVYLWILGREPLALELHLQPRHGQRLGQRH
jgi:hypothetical protein